MKRPQFESNGHDLREAGSEETIIGRIVGCTNKEQLDDVCQQIKQELIAGGLSEEEAEREVESARYAATA